MKKIILVISLYAILICAGCKNNDNVDKNTASMSEDLEEIFIDKEITACDVETEENRYIYECFCECFILPSMEIPPVFGIHYMTEDLNGDGENELLALLQWNTTDGDLLVFHETDGKLYQWETWDDFLCMRMMDIEYHGNGILSQGGGGGALVGRYNAEGKIEYILKYFRDWEHTEEGEYWKNGHLILYKDGYEKKELSWEGIYFHEDDSWEMTQENRANKDEFDGIMSLYSPSFFLYRKGQGDNHYADIEDRCIITFGH